MKFEDECIQKGFTFDSLLKAREKEIPFKPVTPTKNEIEENSRARSAKLRVIEKINL